ncbi:hypothetical protein EVAR_38112_1 [Eumeta japonica]|uniref:Uncharacterized protein n=1 Tax=Eumeta variegata TaxID=151549 RepID=A0A4C1X4K5_EUMVA|nr:hypothetical protein EVAR_38112_1 [Eumeta japonica]
MAAEEIPRREQFWDTGVPEKLEAIRKVVEVKPAPQPQNYAEAAANHRLQLFHRFLAQRRWARNYLECHPVLEVTIELYNRLTKAGYVYMGLQRRSVFAQCTCCLGYGYRSASVKKRLRTSAQSISFGAQDSPQNA